jgi:Flp pilus assembly protein TadD
MKAAAWCAIVAGFGWCWANRASWGRHALLGFGFFLLNLLPVLGFVPMAYLRISRVSDHFAYLPLIGLVGLVAAAAGRWRTTARQPLFWTCACIAAICCAGASRQYARVFAGEETLWTFELQHNPQAWLAHNNLGIVLGKAGRFDEAIRHGEEAVRLRPDFPEARSNLGLELTEARRLPEAIEQLTEAVRLNPDLAGARLNLGRALLAAGRPAEAVFQLEQVLRLQPANPEARRNLAIAHNNSGNALARAGSLAQAIAEFERALQLDPANAGTRRNLGHALQSIGESREATVQFEEADRLDQNR